MKKFSIPSLLFLLILVLNVNCMNDKQPQHYSAVNNNLDTLIFDGVIRTFRLYVPTTYPDTSKSSLVIVLHGYGNIASEMEEGSKLDEKAEKEGFIVVYPNGYNYEKNGNETQYWNLSNAPDQPANGKNDIRFISQLIDFMVSKYTISENRVYATGFSNGAYMCYKLGAELPDKIAAIAPHSGYILHQPNGINQSKVPVFHIHGLKDGVVKYNFGWIEYGLCLQDKSGKCITDVDTLVQSEKYMIFTWENTKNQLLEVKEGRHDWFTTDNEGVSANDFIWEFFVAHPKRKE